MLHLRDLELLDLDALTVSGKSVGDNLAWWEGSERRTRFRELLVESDGVEPDEVILSPAQATGERDHQHHLLSHWAISLRKVPS